MGTPDDTLCAEIRVAADLHTDRLARAAWPQADIVTVRVSRVLLDVERAADDAQEDMSRVRRGVFYTHDRFGRILQRTLLPQDRAQLLVRFYHPHLQRLRKAAAGAMLIDLHTYPTPPCWIEPQVFAARPEIDLRTSPGLTPLDWTDALRGHVQRQGFTVAENAPYAGVIDAGARAAIMIEISLDMLGTGLKSAEWQRILTALREMPHPSCARGTL